MNNSPITDGVWTREDPSGKKSILDYVIANEHMKPEITKIIIDEDHNYKLARYRKTKGIKKEIKSDHNTILLKIKEENEKKKTVKYQMWNIKNQNSWQKFKEDTGNMQIIDEWKNEDDMSKGYKKLQTQLKSLMYKHFERITIKDGTITSRKIRNLTNRRKAVSKEIERCKRKLNSKGVVINYLIEKQQLLKTEITEEIESRRIEQMKRRLGKVTKKAAANEIWNIRKNNMKQGEPNMGIKSKEGYLLTSQKDINERYKSYYEELLQNRDIKPEHEKHNKLIEDNIKLYKKITKYDDQPMNTDITMKEVERAIKSLKKEKTPGPDEFHNEIIINAGKNLKINLLNMLNSCWKLESVPEDLYKVEIKSIYKGKGDIGNLENHRGLFLNSNILKFIEKVILLRATDALESKMSPYQAGGRPNYSIGEQVFILRSILDKCKYYNQPVYLQFIDLRKAFDKMVIKNILQNLWETGIRGRIFRVISKINEKAIIRIKMNASSTTDEFTTGEILKQGSVLAANLAALHTDTLSKKFYNRNLGIDYGKTNIPLLLFQDDVVKFDKSPTDLQTSNIILESFQNENRMEFHPTKTMVMTNNPDPPKIILNNLIVPVTNEYKYLGDLIKIDNNLQPLIWERKNIITGTVAELMNILSQTRQYSIIAAIQYHEGIIIPKLLLNSETWPKITQQDYLQLEQIQSQAIKRLLRLPYSTPTRGLLSELGIMSVENQITKKQLMFLHRIMNKHDKTLSKTIMLEQQNLPGNNWLKNVLNTMKALKLNESMKDLTEITKPKWKKVIEEALKKKEQEDFEEWKNNSKKCEHMKNIKKKNYLIQLAPDIAKIILEIRLGMLDVKENFHGKHKDNICRNCEKEKETSEHFIKCLTSRENEGPEQHFNEIWELKNIQHLEEIGTHILNLMENNPHFEYKMI